MSGLDEFDSLFNTELGEYINLFFSRDDCSPEYLNCFSSIRERILNNEIKDIEEMYGEMELLCCDISRDFNGSPIYFAVQQLLYEINKKRENVDNKAELTNFSDIISKLSQSLHEYQMQIPDDFEEYKSKIDQTDEALPMVLPKEEIPHYPDATEYDQKLLSYAFKKVSTDEELHLLGKLAFKAGEGSGTHDTKHLKISFTGIVPGAAFLLKKKLEELGYITPDMNETSSAQANANDEQQQNLQPESVKSEASEAPEAQRPIQQQPHVHVIKPEPKIIQHRTQQQKESNDLLTAFSNPEME